MLSHFFTFLFFLFSFFPVWFLTKQGTFVPISFYGTKATTDMALTRDALGLGGLAKAPPISG